MNRKLLFLSIALASVLILLAVFVGTRLVTAQEENPARPFFAQHNPGILTVTSGAQSTVTTDFTYQGYLTDGGRPANGTYDFRFILVDALNKAANQLADFNAKDVVVTDGLFTVELDFGPVFYGTALWMSIGVRPGDSTGAYTSLEPPQALTAAPYALSLRPGALISGTVPAQGSLMVSNSGDSGIGVYGNASAATGDTFGVVGVSASTTGRGVYGRAMADSHANYGVYGETYNGYGTYGYATAASGLNYGVFGRSDSESGLGVAGFASATTGETVGVRGVAVSDTGHGVAGYALGSTGDTYGVFGSSGSTTGRGVFGHASAGVGQNYGVYGQSDSPDGHAVHAYSEGDGVYVEHAGGDGLSVCATGILQSCDTSVYNNGVEIGLAEGSGLHVVRARNDGVFVCATGSETSCVEDFSSNGVEIARAENYGLRVNRAGWDGVFVSYAEGNGVNVSYAEGDGIHALGLDYAGYFSGDIYVTGSCTGCTLAAFGLNASESTLEPGDIVAIQGVQSSGFDGAPMLMRLSAALPGETVVGVVQGRAEVNTQDDPRPGETSRRLVPRAGAVSPGDFVTIVIYGPVQIQANTVGDPITVGTRLAVDTRGLARPLRTVEIDGVQLAESAPSLGIALGEPDADGLLWVLINPH